VEKGVGLQVVEGVGVGGEKLFFGGVTVPIPRKLDKRADFSFRLFLDEGFGWSLVDLARELHALHVRLLHGDEELSELKVTVGKQERGYGLIR